MKKKLIIVSVLVLCLVFGTVPVMAAEEYEYGVVDGEGFYYEGVYYEFSDEVLADIDSNANFERQALLFNFSNASSNELWICFYPAATQNLVIRQENSGWWFWRALTANSYYYNYVFKFDLSSDNFLEYLGYSNQNLVSSSSYDELFNRFLWSDRDIYYNDEVVFLGSPLTEVNLQTIVEELELKIVILEVVGLLPLVIGLVVCCLGLRKGWNLLVSTLHRV